MAITFAQILTALQRRTADSSDDTGHTQALDQAFREVCRARRWPELMTRAFITTEDVYETGTVVATVDSATVTLTGGTWPTTVATAPNKHRFALSLSDPWYEIETRTSGTVIELADNYVQDTVSGSAYIAYRYAYSLASDVDRVESMWVHDNGNVQPLTPAATDQQVSQFLHYPSGPGTPTHWYPLERDSAGGKQVAFGPAVADDVFRIEYLYRKTHTDGEVTLDESRWPVVLARAAAIIYEEEFFDRSMIEQRKYEALLESEWASESDTEIQEIRIGDTRFRYPGGNTYLDNLPGFGRVADPT